MSRFAASTQVGADRSRAEIERTLVRYGATGFMYGWSGAVATLAFEISERRILFRLPLPDRSDRVITHTEKGRQRSATVQAREYDQAVRQRWRALALVVKAKLEAVDTGITTLEEEFLAHIVLPSGATVGEHALPAIRTTYETGKMLPLLGG